MQQRHSHERHDTGHRLSQMIAHGSQQQRQQPQMADRMPGNGIRRQVVTPNPERSDPPGTDIPDVASEPSMPAENYAHDATKNMALSLPIEYHVGGVWWRDAAGTRPFDVECGIGEEPMSSQKTGSVVRRIQGLPAQRPVPLHSASCRPVHTRLQQLPPAANSPLTMSIIPSVGSRSRWMGATCRNHLTVGTRRPGSSFGLLGAVPDMTFRRPLMRFIWIGRLSSHLMRCRCEPVRWGRV